MLMVTATLTRIGVIESPTDGTAGDSLVPLIGIRHFLVRHRLPVQTSARPEPLQKFCLV